MSKTDRKNWLGTIGVIIAMYATGIGLGIPRSEAPPADTPEQFRFGWAGPDAVKLTSGWASLQPAFKVTSPDGLPVVQDNATANVRLWHFIRKAYGTDPKNIPQEIGDCTSWGGVHAIQATQGSQISSGKQPGEFKELTSMWLYGAARVWVLNGQLRGDGATGGSICRAAKEHGLIPADLPGLPKYSGRLARQWGRDGPPEQWRAEALKHRIRTTSQVRTADDVRDAICNGYGCIICSDWGASERSFGQQDGRIVATRSAQWMHCMCVDGYDGSVPGKQYFHIQNSWGETLHPAPIDDSPHGGFWVEKREMDYITRQGDSWALSEFDGFPANALDLNIFGDEPLARRQVLDRRQADHGKDRRKREVAL